MSKQTISWHEWCFNNSTQNFKNELARLRSMQSSVDAMEQGLIRYKNQIQEAKKQGKDGFDPERFLVKKTK